MDSIDIEIQSSSEKSTQGIQKLINTLSSLKNSLNSTQKTANKFNSFMSNFKNSFKNFKTPKISQPKINLPNGNGSKKRIEELKEKFSSLNEKINSITGRIKKMFNTIAKSRIAKVGLKTLDFGFGNISNKISETTNRIRKLIKDFSKYALALYGIRSAFYAVRNVSNEFLSSQDATAQQLKANIDYLKFSLGSLLAPVIEYLTNLMYKLLQVIQYIVYFFAKINIFAGRSAKNYASMGASAGKAAKEAQKQLQAFDELNNINLNNNSGSGGGGGGAITPDFDLSKINEGLKPLFDDIDNWGKKLADKINNALYSIKWDVILDGAEKLANGLANFLNDLTYYLDWEEIGYSIAQGFNTALIFVDTFFQKYQWGTLGKNIAEGLNMAISTIKWDVFGKKLTDGIRAAILTLEGFVTTFKWIEFGQKIAEALSSAFFNIPWDNLGNALNEGIKGIFDSIDTFLDTMPWSKIGETIGKFLNDINWKDIFKRVFKTIGKIASGLTDILWSAIFSGKDTAILAGLIASFVSLKAAIKGLIIVADVATKFKALVEVAGGIDKLKTSVLSFSKAFSGITLFITGSIVAVKNFVDAWQNGLNLVNGAFIVLGVTLSSIGLLILGVSAPIVAIVAVVTLAVGTIALLTKAFFSNKAAIKDTEQAQKDYDAALQESKQAQEDYESAIDRASDTFERLKEAQDETGLSGEELYQKVQDGTLTYADMTAEQKKVYKAYKDNKQAQDEAQAATEKMTEAKKEEIKQSFENQLALAKESKNYDEFKKSVVEAFENGKISADEARDLIERSMAGMSDASEQTFMEDIPDDIKDGLDPDKYSSTSEKFKEGFTGWWDNLKNVVSDWWTQHVSPWFTKEKWQELAENAKKGIKEKFEEFKNNFKPIKDWWDTHIAPWFTKEKWSELAQKGVEGIKNAFSNLNIKIKMPHFSWTSQPIGGTVGKILSALNLPASLPKLNVSWYADGGYPDVGELFVANEAGPEMIGKIGNKTTVANNDQITKSIAQAAYEAMNRALNENNNDGQPFNIYFGNERLYSGYTKHKSQASNQYGISI